MLAELAITLALAGAGDIDYPGCHTRRCVTRTQTRGHRRTLRRWRRTTAPYQGWLARVRWCESTNRPWAVDPSGTYFGLYQFDLQTWHSVGGQGYPHRASRAEQDFRAVVLLKRRGTAPWPRCGG